MTDFERGAEAMREACEATARRKRAEHLKNMGYANAARDFVTERLDAVSADASESIARLIRALPLPVQPPGSESREASVLKRFSEELKAQSGFVCRGCRDVAIVALARALAPDARPPSPEKQGDKK